MGRRIGRSTGRLPTELIKLHIALANNERDSWHTANWSFESPEDIHIEPLGIASGKTNNQLLDDPVAAYELALDIQSRGTSNDDPVVGPVSLDIGRWPDELADHLRDCVAGQSLSDPDRQDIEIRVLASLIRAKVLRAARHPQEDIHSALIDASNAALIYTDLFVRSRPVQVVKTDGSKSTELNLWIPNRATERSLFVAMGVAHIRSVKSKLDTREPHDRFRLLSDSLRLWIRGLQFWNPSEVVGPSDPSELGEHFPGQLAADVFMQVITSQEIDLQLVHAQLDPFFWNSPFTEPDDPFEYMVEDPDTGVELPWGSHWLGRRIELERLLSRVELLETNRRRNDLAALGRMTKYFFSPDDWSTMPIRVQQGLVSADHTFNTVEFGDRGQVTDNLRIAVEAIMRPIWEDAQRWLAAIGSTSKAGRLTKQDIGELSRLLQTRGQPGNRPGIHDLQRFAGHICIEVFFGNRVSKRDRLWFQKELPGELRYLRDERSDYAHGDESPDPEDLFRRFLGIGQAGVIQRLLKISRQLEITGS